MATDIAIKNVGPIEQLTIPLPPEGGVVVIKGANGAGKTKAIESINALATGEGKLRPRDGKANGEVAGFGCRILVGYRTQRTGDPQFVSLGSKLDVAGLVEPGMASPEANDARRIKKLVGLSGLAIDPRSFHELVGGQEEFERMVKHASIKPDDPVEMARLVKKDIEEASRLEKSHADTAAGHAKGKQEAAIQTTADIEIDTLPATDEEANAAYEAAVREESALHERAERSDSVAKNRQAALEQLEQAKASYAGMSVEEATAKHDESLEKWRELNQAWQDAEKAATEAGRKAETQRNLLSIADQKLTAAKDHARTIAGWEKTLETAPIPRPTDEEILTASAKVSGARQVVQWVALQDKAKALASEAEEYTKKAESHLVRSENLRAAARSVDAVLSSLVEQSGGALRVVGTEKGPRIVTDTHRGETYYADLSDGERVRIALEIAIGTLKRLAETEKVKGIPLLPILQSFWEGLDPEHRAEVAAIAKEHGVVIVTAECAEGDLRVEVL